MLLGSLLDLQNRGKDHYCVVYIDVPFKHQGLEISMTTFETLVLAGAFLSNHKSCQESEEEGDDGCAQTGD